MASRNDLNPLTHLKDAGLAPEDKDAILHNLRQIMAQEEAAEEARIGKVRFAKRQGRHRKEGWIKPGLAGVASLMVVGAFWGSIVYSHEQPKQSPAKKPSNLSSQPALPLSTTTGKAQLLNPLQSPLAVGRAVIQRPFADWQMVSMTDGWSASLSQDQLRIMHTSDGTKSWQNVTPKAIVSGRVAPYNPEVALSRFGNNGEAVAVSLEARDPSNPQNLVYQPTVFFSTDSGRTWSSSTIRPVSSSEVPVAVDFPSPKTGYVMTQEASAGTGGAVAMELYATTDGGLHWALRAAPNPLTTSDFVRFLNDSTGFALGRTATSQGLTQSALYRTVNGGQSWTPVSLPLPVGKGVSRVDILPPSMFGKVVLVPVVETTGSRGLNETLTVYRSNDSGQHFQRLGQTEWISPPGSTQGGFTDPQHGWFFTGSALYTTADGGSTFRAVAMNPVLPSEANVAFVSANKAFAAVPGMFLASDDGGRTWLASVIG